MNIRQKAKKYKNMYEKLLTKQPLKVNVVQHKIDTLRFEQFYPEEFIIKENSSYFKERILKENSSYFKEVIANGIARDIAHSLNKYVECFTEFSPQMNMYHVYGEIKVVSRL